MLSNQEVPVWSVGAAVHVRTRRSHREGRVHTPTWVCESGYMGAESSREAASRRDIGFCNKVDLLLEREPKAACRSGDRGPQANPDSLALPTTVPLDESDNLHRKHQRAS